MAPRTGPPSLSLPGTKGTLATVETQSSGAKASLNTGRGFQGPSAWLRRHPLSAALVALLLLGSGVWTVKLFRLAQSVEVYRSYWADPRGERGGLVYVALGDSAAQSIGASRPERGYVGLLAKRMREETGSPVLVVNLSRSGATVRDVLDTQFPRLLQLQPDIVTVAVGGNDIRSYNSARFAPRTSRSSPLRCRPERLSPTSPTSCTAVGRTTRSRRPRQLPRGLARTSCRSCPCTARNATGAPSRC